LHLTRNFNHQSFHLMVWTLHPNVVEPCNWSHQNPFLNRVVDANTFLILVSTFLQLLKVGMTTPLKVEASI
jgi:hypothetical protein